MRNLEKMQEGHKPVKKYQLKSQNRSRGVRSQNNWIVEQEHEIHMEPMLLYDINFEKKFALREFLRQE